MQDKLKNNTFSNTNTSQSDANFFDYCSLIIYPKAFIKKHYDDLTFVDWKYLTYLFENTLSKNRLECFISNKIMKQFVSNDTYIKATRKKLAELGLVELKKISGGWLHRLKIDALDERKRVKELNEIHSLASENFISGKISQTIEHCHNGLEIAKELADSESVASFNNLLGQVYTNIGQIDKAFECYNSALKLLESRQPPELYFDTIMRLSDLHFNKLELDQALSGYKTAFETIKIFAPKRDSDFVQVYCKLSLTTFIQGQHSAGAMYLDRAQERYERITDKRTGIYFNFINGHILFEVLDEMKNGTEYLAKAWSEALEDRDFDIIFPIALVLLRLYREDKNFANANKVLDDIKPFIKPTTKQEHKSRLELESIINKIYENNMTEAKQLAHSLDEGIMILGDKVLQTMLSIVKYTINIKDANSSDAISQNLNHLFVELGNIKQNHQFHNFLYFIRKIEDILLSKGRKDDALRLIKDAHETADRFYLNYYTRRFEDSIKNIEKSN